MSVDCSLSVNESLSLVDAAVVIVDSVSVVDKVPVLPTLLSLDKAFERDTSTMIGDVFIVGT